jgi:hypothetical protein
MIEPDRVLSRIATGLSLLKRPATEFPDILELGVRDLQALIFLHGKDPLPASRFDLLLKMETPIQQWWPGALPNCEQNDVLLRFGEPSTFCMEWAYSLRGIDAQIDEIDESVMKKIIDICRSDRSNYYSLYVNSRHFLIEKPVVRLQELVEQVSRGNILNEVQDAYEPIPTECVENGKVFLCCNCHDGLILRDGHLYCRNWIICEKHGDFTKAHSIDFAPDLKRLKRGMKAYVCLPGLPEIELGNKLSKLKLTTRLWPGIDEYDLRITLPSGKVWAVDVKASKSPWILGRREAEKGFIQHYSLPDLRWDRAFYVIDDDFFLPNYEKLFWEGVASTDTRKSNVNLLSMKQFLRLVKREVKNA